MIEMPISELCNADYDKKIKVICNVMIDVQYSMYIYIFIIIDTNGSLLKNNFHSVSKMYVLTVLQIECFDWDKDTEHDIIGGFETTLRELSPAKDREVKNLLCLK